jgi:hypothetical protein
MRMGSLALKKKLEGKFLRILEVKNKRI